MAQMAAELGLSRIAVSAVVNGRTRQARVSESTARRVREHLTKRGYVPSRNACHLRTAPARVIGIMHIGKIFSHLIEAFHKLVENLHGAAQGLEIIMTPLDRIESAVREARARRVTDLVWIHNSHAGEEYREGYISQYLVNMRTIIYNFPFDSPLGEKDLLDHGVSLVGVDRTVHLNRLARLLKQLGHRVIVLPNATRGNGNTRYYEAFEKAGLVVADFPPSFSVDEMRKAMKEHGVTAACFHGDSPACLALSELRAAGIRVPEDLTVTGFDGMSKSYNSDLTTLVIPIEKMVSKIQEIISGAEQKQRHCFDLELVKGRTHGPAAEGRGMREVEG